MNHEDLHERLADYLGDELSPAERQEFEQALAADPQLAREALELQGTLAQLQKAWAPPAEQSRQAVGPRRGALVLRFAALAALLALAFVAGFTARGTVPVGQGGHGNTAVDKPKVDSPSGPAQALASAGEPRLPQLLHELQGGSYFTQSMLVAIAGGKGALAGQ